MDSLTKVSAEALGDKQVEITFHISGDSKLKGYNVYIDSCEEVDLNKNLKLNNFLIDKIEWGLCSIILDCPIGKHSFVVEMVYNDRVHAVKSNQVTICTLPKIPSSITAVPTGFSGQIKVLFTVDSFIDETVKPYMYILSCFNILSGVIHYASQVDYETDEPNKIYTFDNLIDDETYIVTVSAYNIAGNINKTVDVTPIATSYDIVITSVEA